MTAEEYLDKIIIEFDYINKSQYGIAPIIKKYLGHNPDLRNPDDNRLLNQIYSLITEYKYSDEVEKTMCFYEINDNWKEAKKYGGHFNYQIHLKNSVANNQRRIETADKLAHSQLNDIPENKWYRHWTFIVGIIIMLVSILSLIIYKQL